MNPLPPEHPVYTEAFTEDQRNEQMQEDSEAWHAVTGILLAIVSIGVCLAVFTAYMCV